jgi:hypothetical protein
MCIPTTTINLPPRYVQQVEASNSVKLSDSKVHFRLDANEVHVLPAQSDSTSGKSTWYGPKDYANFATEWRISSIHNKNEARRRMRDVVNFMNMGKRTKEPIPTLEELQMAQRETSVSRKNLIQSILVHQAHCRAKGFTDPDGYSFLSKSLSRADRKLAWQIAAVNAYEVQVLFEQPTSQPRHQQSSANCSFSELLADYYMESVHPFLSQPLVFMSKLLLCECD